MNDDQRLAELMLRLDITLSDRLRALQALTHRSHAHERASAGDPLPDNERLEFLGDAVLDLAVSQRLMESGSDLDEGQLSRRRAAVVNEAALAAVAGALGLGELILLGRGEELTGGRGKASVLADTLEAVVAAVYLEHGMAGALRLVDRLFARALEQVAAGGLAVDYKTRVQELVQGQKLGHPRYRVVGQSGPEHARIFEVELSVHGEVVGSGTGASKKEAEQAAAHAWLEALDRPPPDGAGSSSGG
jgi:ribonuclease-3